MATVPELDLDDAVHPYTSVNGHMFSYQTGTLGIRLRKDVSQSAISMLKALKPK
jgi:hypothetical protein